MKQAQVLRALFDRTAWNNYGSLLKESNFDDEFAEVFKSIKSIFEANPDKLAIDSDDLRAVSNGTVTGAVIKAKIPKDQDMMLNMVKEYAQNASILELIGNVAEHYEAGKPIDIERLQSRIGDITRRFSSIGSGVDLSNIGFVDIFNLAVTNRVTPLPVEELNIRLDGGPGGGELLTVIAVTDGGKTMFLLNCARHASEQGKIVLYFTLETTTLQFLERYYCSCCNCSRTALQKPKFQKYLKHYQGWLKDIKGEIVFYDSSDRETRVPDIARAAENVIRAKGRLDTIIVDYGDKVFSSRRYTSAREEQKLVWQEMCRMAKHFDVPVITASQVNREGAKSHLSGSSANMTHVAETWAKATDSQMVLLVERNPRHIQRHTANVRILKTKKSGGYAQVECVFDTLRCRIQ